MVILANTNVGLIILYIVLGLIALWVLLFVVDLIFVGSFFTIFKKHRGALSVILNTKLENIKKMHSLLRQFGIELDNNLLINLQDVHAEDLYNPESEGFEKARGILSYLKDELFFISSQHEELLEVKEFVFVKNNIIETDEKFRSNVSMYNADVLGYNYWISFWPCKFIFKLLKIKKKEII